MEKILLRDRLGMRRGVLTYEVIASLQRTFIRYFCDHQFTFVLWL
jgi:hypothetical protein